MKNIKSHFRFNKQERSGIFFLLLLIILLQVIYFFVKWSEPSLSPKFSSNEREQKKIDSLKKVAERGDSIKIYPFNPNFISDYKGYTLGMSTQEIDRLHEFRAQNNFVNSIDEFQQVTQISDSLLHVISPFFKFPEWVNKKTSKIVQKKKITPFSTAQDLNSVSAEELRFINGIGEKLSARIVKFRDRLGGFLVNEQLYDVYGLEPEVVERTLKHYKVLHPPNINRININTASVSELAALVYIRRDMAERIVLYRQDNDGFGSFDELTQIEGFPTEKIERIKLYLSL